MSGIVNSLYNMRHMDDLARRESPIHNIHPLIKLITTVIYIAVVMSFGKYDIGRLLPFFFISCYNCYCIGFAQSTDI